MEIINSQLEKYIGEHTSPEDDLLSQLNRETHLKVMFPRMLSGHVQGRFLEMISYMINPERILEIGTYTGYSAICLSKGLKKDGRIHTIEINPELANISDKYFRKAQINDQVIQHVGNDIEIIPDLNEIFDLVFIDADKENYLKYYHLIFDKVKKGGFILADNALWDGKVIESNVQDDKETEGIKKFNDFIQNDEKVENVLVSVRDGILLIRKL